MASTAGSQAHKHQQSTSGHGRTFLHSSDVLVGAAIDSSPAAGVAGISGLPAAPPSNPLRVAIVQGLAQQAHDPLCTATLHGSGLHGFNSGRKQASQLLCRWAGVPFAWMQSGCMRNVPG